MVGAGTLGIFIIAAIVASFVSLPYYRISPGSVYDTIERVSAPVDQINIPDGEIGFVTVSQTANISVWEWAWAGIDGDSIIRHEDEVNGDRTTEEKREADRRRMQVSKSAAVVVALQRLGYELIVTPTGVEVAAIFDCSAADGTLGTGDVIIGVDDAEVLTVEALLEQLSGKGIGDELELTVERIDPNNPTRSIATEVVGVTLGSADADCLPEDVRAEEPRPFIGIGTAQMADEDLPFDVDIDTGRVGGPSAGLAFTLAVIDVLSEGELTNGLNIVATGTINRAGQVGPVGGIHQKTVAAERAGADVFIVPACCEGQVDPETGEPLPTNYETALANADDMIVIGVETLDDALAAIGELGGDVDEFLVAMDA
ncbi:MAG: S16 family serine protease [Actinomycetota bacterium]